jgi:ribosome-binding protein aMBF1 (putative translation factor)
MNKDTKVHLDEQIFISLFYQPDDIMVQKDKRKSETKDSYKPAKGNEVSKGHEIVLKTVGDRIEEIRKQKNISVTDLCSKVKMSRTTYYRMINGMVYYNTEKLFKILDFLNTDFYITINNKTDLENL